MAEIIVPELAESITEGTIATWFKQVGDSVSKGEAVLELETDKVNVEIVSEEDGTLQEQKAEEGDTVEVGQVVAVVGEGSGAQKQDAPKEEKSEEPVKETKEISEEKTESDQSMVVATPSARKLAREKGIDLKDVNAADPRGLVRSHDVNNHSNTRRQRHLRKKKNLPLRKQMQNQKNLLFVKKCHVDVKQLQIVY